MRAAPPAGGDRPQRLLPGRGWPWQQPLWSIAGRRRTPHRAAARRPRVWEEQVQRAAHPLAYPALRSARGRPVVRVPRIGVVVSDAAIAREVLLDTGHFSKVGPGAPSDLWTPVLGPSVLLNMEGAEHAALRRALGPLFSPRAVRQLVAADGAGGVGVLPDLTRRLAAGETVDLAASVASAGRGSDLRDGRAAADGRRRALVHGRRPDDHRDGAAAPARAHPVPGRAGARRAGAADRARPRGLPGGRPGDGARADARPGAVRARGDGRRRGVRAHRDRDHPVVRAAARGDRARHRLDRAPAGRRRGAAAPGRRGRAARHRADAGDAPLGPRPRCGGRRAGRGRRPRGDRHRELLPGGGRLRPRPAGGPRRAAPLVRRGPALLPRHAAGDRAGRRGAGRARGGGVGRSRSWGGVVPRAGCWSPRTARWSCRRPPPPGPVHALPDMCEGAGTRATSSALAGGGRPMAGSHRRSPGRAGAP